MRLVPCFLSHLVIDENAEHQSVFITERSGGRAFPITIGTPEALAIDRAVRGQSFPRPLTHDLLAGMVEALGARLERVEIVDLREGTFFARLVLSAPGQTDLAIDARPSDALAMLVRRPGAGLLVAETVLAEAAP